MQPPTHTTPTGFRWTQTTSDGNRWTKSTIFSTCGHWYTIKGIKRTLRLALWLSVSASAVSANQGTCTNFQVPATYRLNDRIEVSSASKQFRLSASCYNSPCKRSERVLSMLSRLKWLIKELRHGCPTEIGKCAFSYGGFLVWNALSPPSLHRITDSKHFLESRWKNIILLALPSIFCNACLGQFNFPYH